MATLPVKAVLLGDTRDFSRKFQDAGSQLQGFGGQLSRVAKLASVALGGGLLAGGAAALKFGGDFNQAFDTIRTGTGAAGEALQALERDFRAVARGVPDGMQAVATAIADVNTLTGATGASLQEMAASALNAARALGEDAGSVIESASRAMNVFGVAAADGSDALEALFVASQATGVGMGQLASLTQTYGPVLKNLGLGLNESVALFGSLQKAGIDVSRVMPGINAAMRRLAGEGVSDLRGALFEQIEAIGDARSNTEALNLATGLFGAEGAQRMTVAIRSGTLEISDLVRALDGSEGAIARNNAATLSLGQRFAILRNQVLVGLQPLFTRAFAAMEQAVSAVMPAVALFSRWLETEATPAVERVADAIGRGLQPHLERLGHFVRHDVLPPIGALAAAVQGDLLPHVRAFAQLIEERVLPVLRELAGAVARRVLPPLRGLVAFFAGNKEFLAGLAVVIGGAVVAAFIALGVAAAGAAISVLAAMAPVLLIGGALALLVGGVILANSGQCSSIVRRTRSDHSRTRRSCAFLRLRCASVSPLRIQPAGRSDSSASAPRACPVSASMASSARPCVSSARCSARWRRYWLPTADAANTAKKT